MTLAIFSGSVANPSCIAARAVGGPSRRSANLGAIFHNSELQCPRALSLRELSLLSFFCPDVCFLWPASVPLSGILTYYRANYCWKCSLDIKTVAFAPKGGNTLSSHRRNAISRKTSMRWRNKMTHHNLRLGKCWKLFWATLRNKYKTCWKKKTLNWYLIKTQYFFPFFIVLLEPVISFGNFSLYVIN